MNLQHLVYFVELAHTLNYTVAAARLNITQPSLSYAISQLEEEIGVQLFGRSGRNSVLTTYGRQFLPYAENSLKTLELGRDMIQSQICEETLIRIGFLRFLGIEYIPHLIADFQKAYPEFKVRFEFETENTTNLLNGVNAGRYDAVFCAPSRRIQKQGSFVHHQQLYLVVPEDHPLSEKDEVALEDTFEYPYIYYPKGTSTRSIIEHNCENLYEKLNIRYEIMEERVVAGFVAAGFGIGILPKMALMATLPVKMLTITEPRIGRDIYMIPSTIRDMTPALTAFIKYVKKHPWE